MVQGMLARYVDDRVLHEAAKYMHSRRSPEFIK